LVVLLWLLDPVNDPANLSFRGKKGFLGIGKPILDKSSRYCHFRSGLEFINIGCEALGGRFCKPQSMIGLVQSKIKIFTFHRFTPGSDPPTPDPGVERHYSVGELARLWSLSEKTIRRIFENAAGVLQWGSQETRFKRGYTTLRIPESVMLRVHRRLRIAG
jgi:hypothetical protein